MSEEVTAHHGLLTDVNLYVDDTGGSGRPVVLIHGWPLSAESWSEQIAPLEAAGYRVIAYDRRGFGRSDKPRGGYDYDTLSDDLDAVITALGLNDVTLVGFSMGGGEVARYVAKHGEDRLRSVVFAAAVTPYLAKSPENPDGPLDKETADTFEKNLKDDAGKFYETFVTMFYSAGDRFVATEEQKADAIRLSNEADHHAALATMGSWGTTDFRDDLTKVTVPTLVIHGDADAVVDFEGSGARTHAAIAGSELHVVKDGPHGINVTNADEFNRVLIDFLEK